MWQAAEEQKGHALSEKRRAELAEQQRRAERRQQDLTVKAERRLVDFSVKESDLEATERDRREHPGRKWWCAAYVCRGGAYLRIPTQTG